LRKLHKTLNDTQAGLSDNVSVAYDSAELTKITVSGLTAINAMTKHFKTGMVSHYTGTQLKELEANITNPLQRVAS